MKGVSKTAYYCCGVRMQDAASARPVLNDIYAKRLMGEEGLEYWEEFKNFKMPNGSNTARAYIIDKYLEQQLADKPNATIIIIGAGLDSRAYRLNGGNWIEIDDASVIEYKNEILPISECGNKLQRISINFETEKLSDKLSSFTNNKNVLIVIEGVLMYLTNEQKESLIKTITTLFPKHLLYCDLMTKKFFDKLGHTLHKKLAAHGASFTDLTDDPTNLFLKYGYRQIAQQPTILKSLDLKIVKAPKFLMKLLLGRLINGYSVYSFVHE